ncbi:hypothetical protein MKW92_038392 [Papaver armeniacum]|nr:hypothetical protein MKW92_038392 [Papaver armeniacum]
MAPLMKPNFRKQSEFFWPRIVLKKLLNIHKNEDDFSADPDEADSGSDSDDEEIGVNKVEQSKFVFNGNETFIKRRRRNSETFRTQYINNKEIRVCVGTWNVGGVVPPDDLDIKDWLDTDELADIYVLGFQEIVPLNAGNIFGAEDNKPVQVWESVIRNTLNKTQPLKEKTFKCYSAPPSPTKTSTLNDIVDMEDEILNETSSDDEIGEEVHPFDDELMDFDGENDQMDGSEDSVKLPTLAVVLKALREEEELESEIISPKILKALKQDRLETVRILQALKVDGLENEVISPKILSRLNCLKLEDSLGSPEPAVKYQQKILNRNLSGIEKIGLSWPEPPMNFVGQHVHERAKSFKSVKTFKKSDSIRKYNSFKPAPSGDRFGIAETDSILDCDLDAHIAKKRPPFVKIVSKQMVGVFITIWVRRGLRRHIQNLKVSTVGVGVMGYIGNKGSVSVSMSIYQTPFCFICTHLTSGEKEESELKRNADVQEIHRRTQFHSVSAIGLAKTISDHERVVWFGDLNYRISLPYEKTCKLISESAWSSLLEKDQLSKEFKKGRVFEGWKEGTLSFAPTYKYEPHSRKYCGEDPTKKEKRRVPSWCDRILSFGKGLRNLNYRRTENLLSDHRPVTALFMAEVEVFCHRKLKKALVFTDAELALEEEEEDAIRDLDFNIGIGRSRFG